jgi:hypothetical protein
MKLNRGLLLASALLVGSLAVVGCSNGSSDDGVENESATTEQASADQGSGSDAVAGNDEGTVQYARFGGHAGGRGHGFGGHGRAFGHGFRGGVHGRFEHGRRPWWRVW